MTTKSWSIHPAIAAAIILNIAVMCIALAFSGNEGRMFTLLHEDGIVEWMQFLCFTAISMMMAYVAIDRWMRYGMSLSVLGIAFVSLVVAMAACEEVSWFQRVLDMPSPEYFKANNRQGEMNLHNLALGKASWHKTVLLKLIALIGLTHNVVLPILARSKPAVRRFVESLGLYLPPLTAAFAYILLVILSTVLIDHPRKGELGELFGATHYFSTAFAAYVVGLGYDSPTLIEGEVDRRKVTVFFIMALSFLMFMAWMLTSVNRMGAV